MIRGLHHAGIAVAEIEVAIELYRELGALVTRRGELNGLQFALLDSGGVELELLHSDDRETAIGKFVSEHGPGLHHLAYAVADTRAELQRLLALGMEQAGEVRIGVHGTPIVFLHPKSVGGVLTELVEVGDGGHPA